MAQEIVALFCMECHICCYKEKEEQWLDCLESLHQMAQMLELCKTYTALL